MIVLLMKEESLARKGGVGGGMGNGRGDEWVREGGACVKGEGGGEACPGGGRCSKFIYIRNNMP